MILKTVILFGYLFVKVCKIMIKKLEHRIYISMETVNIDPSAR